MSDIESPATVYFARWVLAGDEIIHNGAVRVVGNKIDKVGFKTGIRETHDRIINLGDTLLMPGMINIYTRLEEAILRHKYTYFPGSLTALLDNIEQDISQFALKEIETSAKLAVRESLSNGITSTVNSFFFLRPALLKESHGRFWHVEDISKSRVHTRFELANYIRNSIGDNRIQGITPEHIYSLSPQWLKESVRAIKEAEGVYITHLSGSPEELEAFTEHQGELYDLLKKKDMWYFDDSEKGASWYAIHNSLLPRNSIIINPLYCSGPELGALAAQRCSIAVSPRYAMANGLSSFPIENALNRKINVTVSTESPSRSQTMNLLDELFEIRMKHPSIPALDLIKMITENPAKALRADKWLGKIEAGYVADLTGVTIDPLSKNPLEDAILGNSVTHFLLIDGEEIIVP